MSRCFCSGLKKQGISFTVYAVYTVAIYSLFAWLITDVFPVDVSVASPLAGSDLFAVRAFRRICVRRGQRTCNTLRRCNGRNRGYGGHICKAAGNYGRHICHDLQCNFCTYAAELRLTAGFLPLYSIVTYGAGIKTVDFIVEGIDRSKSAMIVTSKPDEICAALSKQFECGMTIMDAKGYYSGDEKIGGVYCYQQIPGRKNAGACPQRGQERLHIHFRYCGRFPCR